MPKNVRPKNYRGEELRNSLRILIDNFHETHQSQDHRKSAEDSLRGILREGFSGDQALITSDWTAGVRQVYRNSRSSLSSHDQDTLLNIFASFTLEEELLRKLLKAAITAEDRDAVQDTQEIAGLGDEEGSDDDDSSAAEQWQSWQEWIGRKMLATVPHLVVPKRTSNVTQAMDISQSILSLAVRNDVEWVVPSDFTKFSDGDEQRLKQLLRAESPETLLEAAVKLGHLKTARKLMRLIEWGEIAPKRRDSLLYTSITTRKPYSKPYSMEIIRGLVNSYPDIIDQFPAVPDDGQLPNDKDQAPNKQSALQILRNSRDFAEHDKELEDFLVSKIIRRTPLARVKRLLFDKSTKELYVNLSFFNDERNDFDSFLTSLVESKFNIEFYSTLMYVEIPRLGENTETEHREEVFVVLNWLRKSSVHTILELHIPDALHTPHRDEDIEVKLGLEIETLNWEKLDMSLETLKAVKGLRKVYLYSDNWNTLAYWTSPEGLFAQEYINNNISLERAERYKKKAESRICSRQDQMRLSREETQNSRKLQVQVETHIWKSNDPQGQQQLALENGPLTAREVTELHPFLRQDPRPEGALTRVAIIDNGIDASIPKIMSRVAASQSFVEVERTREASWWAPSDPHGTQMASIIVDIDPRCELYIAKVGTGRESEVNRSCVHDALEWATVEKEVDIVVMCLTYTDIDIDIATLIQKAHDEGRKTLFFCATEDKGKVSKKVYPASSPHTFAISSCTRGGKEGETTDPSADYYFQGEEVHADCLSYWSSKPEAASGSSVATAVAAGVASLILSCRLLAERSRPNEKKSERTRKQTIEAAFEAMKEDKEDKYVCPGRFFKEEQEEGMPLPWTTRRWQEWVHDSFGPGKQQYG